MIIILIVFILASIVLVFVAMPTVMATQEARAAFCFREEAKTFLNSAIQSHARLPLITAPTERQFQMENSTLSWAIRQVWLPHQSNIRAPNLLEPIGLL